MSDDYKPFSHFDTTLGTIISDEKYEAQTEELIINKSDIKRIIFDKEMPFKSNSAELQFVIERQRIIEDRVDKFIDLFNQWSIDSILTKGSEEIFNRVFDEVNEYAFFGLNFDSNKYYEARSGKYIDDNNYVHYYPNYRQSKLMFYYDESDLTYKVIFVLEQKISSIAHNDTGYFHTIVLKTPLLEILNYNKEYDDFFTSMMMLIKGNVIFTQDDNLKKILEVK